MSPATTATGASYGWSAAGGSTTEPMISFTMSSVVRLPLPSGASWPSVSTNFTDLGPSALSAPHSSSSAVVVVDGAATADLCAFFFFYTLEIGGKHPHHTTDKSTHHYFIENNSIKSTWMDLQERSKRNDEPTLSFSAILFAKFCKLLEESLCHTDRCLCADETKPITD